MKIERAFKKIGKKADKDFKRAGGQLKKAGRIGKQIARGIDTARDASVMAATFAPVLGPQAAVAAHGLAKGLTAVSKGVRAGRTVGAAGVQFGNKAARTFKKAEVLR